MPSSELSQESHRGQGQLSLSLLRFAHLHDYEGCYYRLSKTWWLNMKTHPTAAYEHEGLWSSSLTHSWKLSPLPYILGEAHLPSASVIQSCLCPGLCWTGRCWILCRVRNTSILHTHSHHFSHQIALTAGTKHTYSFKNLLVHQREGGGEPVLGIAQETHGAGYCFLTPRGHKVGQAGQLWGTERANVGK